MRILRHRAIQVGQAVSTQRIKNFEKFTSFPIISSLYVPDPYVSASAKNRGILAAYVGSFLTVPEPSVETPWNLCPWKSYVECEWRVCVNSFLLARWVLLPHLFCLCLLFHQRGWCCLHLFNWQIGDNAQLLPFCRFSGLCDMWVLLQLACCGWQTYQ